MGEEAKIAVRNVRRDALDKFKAKKKAGELTEDDLKNLENEMQKITDKFVKEIDKTCEAKKQRDHGNLTEPSARGVSTAGCVPRGSPRGIHFYKGVKSIMAHEPGFAKGS